MDSVILSLVVTTLLTYQSVTASEYVSVCYYTSWSANRANLPLPISEIDPGLCTHLVYAFANVDLPSLKLVPSEPTLEDSLAGKQGYYAKFNMLKEKNKNLHTLLSVGGEDIVKSNEFATLANDPTKVAKFAKNAAEFLRKRGFDGLDIDWEYPNATTKAAYTQLLQVVREEFDKEAKATGKRRLLLTVAVAAGEEKIVRGYDITRFTRYVDYIFIMTYDFFGTWSTVTGFNSPLRRRSSPKFSPAYNVEYAVNVWLNGGAERNKLVVGMTGAGASFTLNDTNNHAVGAPVKKGGGNPGPLVDQKGRLMYPEICMNLNIGWKKEWDTEQQVPYAYKGNQWVGYDDPRSIKEKVKYAMENKLGGVMFWELSFDDPQGLHCNEGKFPLLNAVKNTLGFKEGKTPLTKDVDPGIVLMTKGGATSIYGKNIIFSALLCVYILHFIF